MAHLENFNASDMKTVLAEKLRELNEYKNQVDPLRLQYDENLMGNTSSEDVVKRIYDRVFEVMGDHPVQTHTNIMSSWKFSYPKEHCVIKPVLDENGEQVYKRRKVADINGEYKKDENGDPVYKNEPQFYWWPKNMDHYEKWEATCIEFIKNRYGAENVVNADRHLSEFSPHITVDLVPVGKSRKSKVGRISVGTASVFTKKDLRTFHDDLQKFFDDNDFFKGDNAVDMHNDKTVGIKDLHDYEKFMDYIRDVAEMATAQLQETLDDRKNIVNRAANIVNKREQKLDNKEKDLNDLEISLHKTKQTLDEREGNLNERDERIKAKEDQLNNLEHTLSVRKESLDEREEDLDIKSEELEKIQNDIAALNDQLQSNEIDLQNIIKKQTEYLEKLEALNKEKVEKQRVKELESKERQNRYKQVMTEADHLMNKSDGLTSTEDDIEIK